MELDRDRGTLGARALKLTVSGLLDDLIRDYRANGKNAEWCEMLVAKQLRPEFGHLAIAKLTGDHVERFKSRRLAEGKAKGTINNELALLRRAFHLGTEMDPPKVHRVPRIKAYSLKGKNSSVRKGFFEDREYRTLFNELPADIRPVFAFAYCTGCRKGEILLLRWEQVDLAERIVRLESGATKNDEGRVIPLIPELYEILAMQKSIRDSQHPEYPWVFNRHGKRVKKFQHAWEYACERAGFWDEENERPTKRFHDLRRTGVRNLVRAGVPETVAMRISGHKTRAVFDRYNIVNEADLRDAGRKLAEHMAHKREQATADSARKTHTLADTQVPSGSVQ